MGKKKIAVVDLSKSESPQLKATGVRSQKLTFDKKAKLEETPVAIPVKEIKTAKKPVDKTSKIIKKDKSKTTKKRVKHSRSKRYLNEKAQLKLSTAQSIETAVKLIKNTVKLNFDPSVELHLNLTVDKLSGELSLPHGTGKTQTVEIASDKTLGKLKAGKIDFDILVSTPQMMPKLAQYAKLLGPKGLMPNPKTGTISADPESLKKKLSGGTIRYKSENKAPIIHLVVGKLSFKQNQLTENIQKAVNIILPKNIKSAYLCASMSPSIKLQIKKPTTH